jgi:hypothetical protein
VRLRDHEQRGAVLRRELGHPVGGDQPAGARHVARHDRRIAGDVLANMTCKKPAAIVVVVPDRVTDDQADGLAAIEFGGRLGVRRRRQEDDSEVGDGSDGPEHKMSESPSPDPRRHRSILPWLLSRLGSDWTRPCGGPQCTAPSALPQRRNARFNSVSSSRLLRCDRFSQATGGKNMACGYLH